jgi:hypothetical protein
MNLHTAQNVRAALTDTPQKGEAIAAAAGVSFEDAHHALAWLYDAGMAFIARGKHGKRIAGWVA